MEHGLDAAVRCSLAVSTFGIKGKDFSDLRERDRGWRYFPGQGYRFDTVNRCPAGIAVLPAQFLDRISHGQHLGVELEEITCRVMYTYSV